MFKSLMAVIGAAVGAGMIVALIPPPGEAIAARTPQGSPAETGKLAGLPAARGVNVPKPVCTQHWPYYEQACLSDLRQPNGNARTVRRIAGNLQSKRALHVRR
jgi:hypothetical protein